MQNQNFQNGIIEAPLEVSKIRNIYNLASNYYFLAAPLLKKQHLRGIELAEIKPNDKVLEVAVGMGQSFLQILKRVDRKNIVYGVDLTPAMLEKTRKLTIKNGYTNFNLREADARNLPFPDETFDVLYNSYMLEFIPLTDLPIVLREFYRVLKKEGRLILINLSKKNSSPVFYEKFFYRLNPYLFGRPLLMESFVKEAGFRNVTRETPKTLMTSEIVTGLK